ncbi:MAG: 20S proteasome A and B subunit [Candidatus Gottesmanbacteria bacterium GW2011_GWB1_49_7]|uniref:20S proteasome A and B subunit n=1 Tax=Candidatus Gottesmanbacteria bacterium GW2011_GWB1_49_7 TaxID=1618448 RepID=A0A0G1YTW4_9BACT|nr:MAG: 20S proteasome A and B subunit [Candidatus Gottesmanbacteria bacterium GW2011_GWB1_49_7]
MTTIAYRDGLMAADSQASTESYLEKTPCQKIYQIACDDSAAWGGALVGLAQGSFAGLVFLEWLKGKRSREEMSFDLMQDDDFLSLVVHHGKISIWNRYLVPDYPASDMTFWAIGSGAKVALGAMECGATAEEAVRVAAKYDLFTGGEIVTARAQ